MSKPSSSRIVFKYFHLTALKPSPNTPINVQIPTFRTWLLISARTHFSSLPNITRIFDRLYPDAEFFPNIDFHGFRCFSLKNEMGSKYLAKDAVKNPVVAFKDTFLWYKETFWKRKFVRCCWVQYDMQLLGQRAWLAGNKDDVKGNLEKLKEFPQLTLLVYLF